MEVKKHEAEGWKKKMIKDNSNPQGNSHIKIILLVTENTEEDSSEHHADEEDGGRGSG